MKVIMFGGAGFIGTSLTKILCDRNFEVTIYDRDLERKKLPTGNYKKVNGNFFSEKDFSKYLQNQDVVIHLISGVSPVSSMINIYDAYEKDLIQTLKLIESCKENGIKKVIFISSGGTVYGEQEIDTITEDLPLFPQNHYGIMKSTIEQILVLYNKLYGMNNVILRLANPYGSTQDSSKKIGAVTAFWNNIVNNQDIEIYGDGGIIRDYIEIEDVCESIVCALKYQASDISPIFNVGTGIGTNLLEIIDIIEQETDIKANVKFKGNRNIDVRRNVLSIEKSKKYLHFTPKLSLQEGIKNILTDYRAKDESNNNNSKL